jgi:Family of unknown function (DUF6292)
MSTSALSGPRSDPLSGADVDLASIPLPRCEPRATTTTVTPRRASGSAVGAPPSEGGVPLDERMLLDGYLTAVARRLEQRGISVREMRADCSESGRLAGMLALAPPPGAGRSRWIPARLEWGQDRGWSATLVPIDQDIEPPGSPGVLRFLPRKLVPAPDAVAHFVAALTADEHTIWACATFQPPHRADRRWLILQLSRFALPEPWHPPPEAKPHRARR